MDQNENTENGPEQNQAQAEPDVMQQESPRKCEICGSPNHQGCGCEAKERVNTINEYIFRLSDENTSREQVIEAVKQIDAADNVKLTEALQCSIDETPGALADYLGFTEQTEQQRSEAKRQAKAMVEIENIHKAKQPTSEAQTPAPVEDDNLEDILSPQGIIREHEAFLQMVKDVKMMADGFEGLCACMYDTNNYLKLITAEVLKKTETEMVKPVGCILTIQGIIEKHLDTIRHTLEAVKERMDKDATAKNQN